MALLPVDEALQRLLGDAKALASETVPLSECAKRVLAEPVIALRTQPPFNASAMDGYAVRMEDVTGIPARLTVKGIAPAGKQFNGHVGQGEAVRIFTGAPVPEGADTIVIQENVRDLGSDTIEITETVGAGRHIRRRGLDFNEGEVLLAAGRQLDPAALSLAAAGNHPRLEVVRQPLVAIIATGDELMPPGSETAPDQIIASNAYGVGAIAQAAGARVMDLGIARDTKGAIGDLIQAALDTRADVIVTLGGASVGDHDLVHDVLTDYGMRLDFWRIAMRPGKPLMFGRVGETRCIGLPGNPVASLICAHLFLVPLLSRLGGRPYAPVIEEARLGEAMAANDHRQDYVRASLIETGEGLVATPFQVQDSSMLRTFSDAGALIIRAPNAPASSRGDTCRVTRLR